ncbi:unnamed protein product [Zymoseptoria tritici ST99CH_3D1]|uniref:Uncharacterized protein n=2 Tax=Zymoseptoria tritici TaxID=1047171 RepID=A0A1X7RSU0_ZYMT9|nr:unnamed protein product [Zymoseptoria tritici ST99CH_3D7]SMR51009.1 unnamed protein product [Zymoseptoria tritici ST99CH_1E4]SMR51948.1 unnamed protein product [Zymoseptoria tritici ST99CH_3D1]
MATRPYISIQYEGEELGEDHKLGCKCCRFRAGHDLPIPATLTIEETRVAAQRFSYAIFRDWTQLNAIIKRFEGTLQKRWMKKNVKQRRDVLLKAWPDISTTHRPDFANFRESKKQISRARTMRSEAFLWPYINLEDLVQRHLLLLFLNSRGRTLPDIHRAADFDRAHVGFGFDDDVLSLGIGDQDFCCASHFLEDNPIEELCMVVQSRCSPAKYATVVDPDKLRLVKKLKFKHIRPATEGLVTLEIQHGIYRFLLACAKLILHDVEPAMLFLAPHQPEPDMPVPRTTEWENVTTHALEASYKNPQKLNLERLKMLVGGRRSAAEDHVYSLKEDPGYFINHVREWREHSDRFDRGKDACFCFSCAKDVAPRAVQDAFTALLVWDDIYRKLEFMDPMDVQMGRANEDKVRLADEDAHKWTAMSCIVKTLVIIETSILKDGIPNSPRLRNISNIFLDKEGVKDWAIASIKASDGQQRVHNLFQSIFDEYMCGLHRLQKLVEEVQYMLDNDDDATQYLDSWIVEHFSDLALLCELIKAILSLQPWYDTVGAMEWNERLTRQGQRMNKVDTTLGKLVTGIPTISPQTTRRFCDPSDSDFEYPADKARTKANVEKMRRAEKHLDDFWGHIEGEIKEEVGLDLQKIMRIRAFEPRTIYRTPPWQEPETPTRKTPTKILGEVDPNVNVYRAYDSPTRSKFTPTPAKEKVKTRGVIAGAHHPRTVADDAAPVEPEEVATPKVKIKQKAFNVFCSLLPTTMSANQPCREIAWDDFLSAMDAIGLKPEKLYGSVWHFQPCAEEFRKVHVTRSISFHEPKEVRRGNKIPRPMVRTFGRRLKHAYGWTDAESMFEVE